MHQQFLYDSLTCLTMPSASLAAVFTAAKALAVAALAYDKLRVRNEALGIFLTSTVQWSAL